ncbi:MAG: hypothetical protein QOH76_3970 [Thermoleophilaceae bacterium]|jgi:hypothetical protein|nr:hypothetical protein [Thermoleophilaceae bacterium]
MRLDPDSLSAADWETLDAVDHEPAGPAGAAWPDETNLLVKLSAWASWGLFLAECGCAPPTDPDPGTDQQRPARQPPAGAGS